MPDESLPIGLGTYEHADSQVSADDVAYALETGYRHVDTAQMYGNEDAVGEGLRRADVDREEVVVATKLAPDNLAREDVLASARDSMDRLGVDYLDLLYVHWPDTTYDPEETLGALDTLREEGLVRHVGMANCTPELLVEAIGTLESPLFAHQVECHPLLPQDELRRLAREHDHHLVAYSPLGKGEVLQVDALQEIAAKRGWSTAQVALAWSVAKGSVPIPKSSTEAHIEQNHATVDLRLAGSEVERIDAVERTYRAVDGEGAPWRG